MANELNFYGDLSQTGLTVYARVYDSTGTVVGSDVACPETGTLAIYVGNMPTAAVGQYGVRFFDSSDDSLLSQGSINWDGSKEIEFNILDVLADTNELQTNQGNWTTATSVDLNNNAITSNKVATGAFNNSSFTTGYFNSINSEVDTALSDYDAPTKAELDTAEANIIAEVNANEAKIDAIPTTDSVADLTPVLTAISNLNDIDTAAIRTELATELTRIDANVSSVAYDDSALTALVNALPTLAQMEASAALTAIADITGLSTHDAADVVTAMQVVADDFKDKNVEAEIHAWLDTYTNKDDWKGSGGSVDLTPVQTVVDAILVDTNELQQNQVDISGLSTFDHTTDQVVASNMRGTDGANTVTPPNTAEIEAALLNEGDGQQLIDAIVQAIGNTNVSEVALIAAIRADLERNGGLLDLLPTLAEIEASTVLAKTSDITGLTIPQLTDILATIKPDLTIINEGVKKSSLIIPHSQNLT